jgi:cytidine deaminase
LNVWPPRSPLSELDLAGAQLVDAARAVRERAYAPYSGFRVGAAVETESGQVFVGANVENASYGATICAERAAVFGMIAAGERKIARVAVYAEGPGLTMPCGMCRQVLVEHGRSVEVIVAGPSGMKRTTLALLLPEPFVFEVPK